MPRKKTGIDKQPLRFLERPAGGARVHHDVPEVRAALNPKEFFTEVQGHDGSTLNSWVSPQFDTSDAARPVKRRRGKMFTSVLGNFTQLPSKSSVCSHRFPTLLFQTKPRDQHQKQRKKVLDKTVSLASNSQEFSQKTNTNNVQKLRTVETGLLQNNDVKPHNEDSKTSRLCQTPRRSCPSSFASKDCAPAENPLPLTNPVTPKISEEYSSTFSKPQNLLWPPACTPSRNSTIDILVPDTPESDYGVKVTWRRRKKLMLLLKAKGHLSDSEALIHI